MSTESFRVAILVLAAAFTAAFVAVCVPPFLQDPDVIGAFGAGFALYLLLRLKQSRVGD